MDEARQPRQGHARPLAGAVDDPEKGSPRPQQPQAAQSRGAGDPARKAAPNAPTGRAGVAVLRTAPAAGGHQSLHDWLPDPAGIDGVDSLRAARAKAPPPRRAADVDRMRATVSDAPPGLPPADVDRLASDMRGARFHAQVPAAPGTAGGGPVDVDRMAAGGNAAQGAVARAPGVRGGPADVDGLPTGGHAGASPAQAPRAAGNPYAAGGLPGGRGDDGSVRRPAAPAASHGRGDVDPARHGVPEDMIARRAAQTAAPPSPADAVEPDLPDLPTPPPRRRPAPRMSAVIARPGQPEARPVAIPEPDIGAVLKAREEKRLALARANAGGRLAPDGTGGDGLPTRTAETTRAYVRRGNQLVARYRMQHDMDPDLGMDAFDPVHFANWIISLRVQIRPGSFRIYRQAALMKVNEITGERAERARRLLEDSVAVDNEMVPERKPRDSRKRLTSANKAKSLPHSHWESIQARVKLYKRTRISNDLLDWLRAGLATGLRPREWEATTLSSAADPSTGVEHLFLFVLNAKATNGRANGVVRTLDLTGISVQSKGAVERMSRRGLEHAEAGTFVDWQRKVSQALYRIAEKLTRKDNTTYALYSCRHQFIANMKSLQSHPDQRYWLKPGELAAMVGHNVDVTAHMGYAKKYKGWSFERILDKPRGVPEEIETVELRLRMDDERRRLLELARGLAPRDGQARPDDDLDDGDEDLGIEA